MRTMLALAVLLAATPAAASADPILRHVEYDVVAHSAMHDARTHLMLDLVATREDRGCTVAIVESGDLDAVRVELDPDGTLHAPPGAVLTREEALLAYFFALGAVNTSGMGTGDAWTAGPTHYKVLAARGEGVLDLAVEHTLRERAWTGRLVYDSSRVVPIAFDLRDDAGGRIALKLTADSQGR